VNAAAPVLALLLVSATTTGAAAAGGADTKYVIDPGSTETEPAYLPEYRQPIRFVIGFDIGLGVLGGLCGGCDHNLGGVSADFFAGAQLTRRLAVIGELLSVAHMLPADSADDRGVATHTFATVAARFWATPELWLQTGVGAATFRVDGSSDDQGELAPAFALAIGGELDHAPTRTISLAAHLGMGIYEDDDGSSTGLYNIAVVVGWHWF